MPPPHDLARALRDDAYREWMYIEGGPVPELLARVGGYAHDPWTQTDYQDVKGGGYPRMTRGVVPLDPTVPFATYAHYLDVGTEGRRLVARHPSTPEAVLLQLARDPEPAVQQATMDGGRPGHALLALLARSEHAFVRELVARRADVAHDILLTLAADPAPRVRRVMATRRDLDAALRVLLAPELAALAPEDPRSPRAVARRESLLARGIDEAQLRRALDDRGYRQTLRYSEPGSPLVALLARLGALVGTAPDATLTYEEMSAVADCGASGRRLVAAHPSTPSEIAARLRGG